MSFQTGVYGPVLPPPSDLFPLLIQRYPITISLALEASKRGALVSLREYLQNIVPANTFTEAHQYQAFPNWPRGKYLAGLGESNRLPLDYCVWDKSHKTSADWLTSIYGGQLPLEELAPGAQRIGKGTLYAIPRRTQVHHEHGAASLQSASGVREEEEDVLVGIDGEDDFMFGSMEGVGGEESRREGTEQHVGDDTCEHDTACPAGHADTSLTDDLFAGFSGVQEAALQEPERCPRQLYLLNKHLVAGHQVLENWEAYWNRVEGRTNSEEQNATGEFPRVEIRPPNTEGLITAERNPTAAKAGAWVLTWADEPDSDDENDEDSEQDVLVYPHSPALQSAFEWDDSDDESDEEDEAECDEGEIGECNELDASVMYGSSSEEASDMSLETISKLFEEAKNIIEALLGARGATQYDVETWRPWA